MASRERRVREGPEGRTYTLLVDDAVDHGAVTCTCTALAEAWIRTEAAERLDLEDARVGLGSIYDMYTYACTRAAGNNINVRVLSMHATYIDILHAQLILQLYMFII